MFKKFQHNPSIIGKHIFPQAKWESNTHKIIMTFDDGPNPGTTEIILHTLNGHAIKAVFFCSGSQAQQYPELLKIIKSEGHLVGSHAMTHTNLRKLNKNRIEEEITGSQKLLSGILQEPISYFRPPYGKFNNQLLRTCLNHNLTVVFWSLLFPDYKNDINLVKFAMQYLSKNAITVLHDNQLSKPIIADSIELLIDNAQELQYEFGNPLECLK
jgi:peptidoglycan-N-acetylglucosamine deacetylase